MAHTQVPYMCTCEQKAQISRLCVMHAAMRLSLGRTTATVMVVRPSRLARDLSAFEARFGQQRRGGDDGDTGGLGQATPDGCVHEMSSFSG